MWCTIARRGAGVCGAPKLMKPASRDGFLLASAHRAWVTSGRRYLSGKPSGDHEEMRGLPESRRPIVEEESIPATEEELAKRRAAALRRWLENEMGEERAALTALLAKHGVKMRGGADEARAFVEELLEWKAEGMIGDGERRKN